MNQPRLGILLAAALALSSAMSCGLQDAGEDPDRILERARQTYHHQGAQAALPVFEKALRLYRAQGDLPGEAKATNQMGICWLRLANHERARSAFNKAISILQGLDEEVEVAKALNNLGLIDWKEARSDQACQRFEESLKIAAQAGDEKVRGAALGNLGLVYDDLGNHARSLELYRQALSAFQKAEFQKGIADTLGNLGGRWLLMGDYKSALQDLVRARQASRSAGLKYEESVDAGNIGLSYLGLGEIEQALESFEEALRLSRQIGAPKEEADWRRAKGKALQWSGDYEQAAAEFEAASRFYSQSGLLPDLAAALRELGATFLLLGDTASSEQHFSQALDLSQKAGLKRGIVSNAVALGDLHWQEGDYDQALHWYRQACQQPPDQTAQAICLMRSSLVEARLERPQQARRSAQRALEIADRLGGPHLLARAWTIRGQVEQLAARPVQALQHYEAARSLSRNVQDEESEWRIAFYQGQCLEQLGAREEAAQAYADAIALLERLRQGLLQDRFYAGYLDSRYQPYYSLVPLLVEMGYYEKALLVADRLRGRPFRSSSRVPPEIIRGLLRPSAQDGVFEQPNHIQKDFSAVPSPRSESLIAEVRSRLAPDAAVVEYLVTDQRLIAFMLSPSDLRAAVVPLNRQSLTARIELLRGLLPRTESRDWEAPAKGLSHLLIEPLLAGGWLEGVRQLVIIPHGILHYLPFSALLRSEGKSSRLLVEDFTISYRPSLHRFTGLSGLARIPGRGMLALMPQSGRLRHAESEVQEIERLFPGRCDILSGSDAKESVFKSRAGRYETIHLATHSDFRRDNPLKSSLLLEPGDSQDGRLEAGEIARLRLSADLVVLSACETALGAGYFNPLPPGDDFVSLTRAFLRAGSRSVVASQWRVEDRATARLIGEFYRKRSGSGNAEALAQAQREMLASPEFAHPFYWAAFALIGD